MIVIDRYTSGVTRITTDMPDGNKDVRYLRNEDVKTLLTWIESKATIEPLETEPQIYIS